MYSGILVTPAGMPLAGATVTLWPAPDRLRVSGGDGVTPNRKSGVTDAAGRVRFSLIPGLYSVAVRVGQLRIPPFLTECPGDWLTPDSQNPGAVFVIGVFAEGVFE